MAKAKKSVETKPVAERKGNKTTFKQTDEQKKVAVSKAKRVKPSVAEPEVITPTDEQIEEAAKLAEEQADTAEEIVSTVKTVPPLIHVYLDNDKAPHSGYGHYFVISQTAHRSVLLCPFTLTRFTLPTEHVAHAPEIILSNNPGHGLDAERLSSGMEAKLKDYARRNIQHPSQLVRSVIAVLRGVDIDTVPVYRKESPAVKQAAEKRKSMRAAAGPGPVSIIREMITSKDGASKEEIMAKLTATFPERPAKAMSSTLSGRLRDGCNSGKTVTKKEVKGRGEVYHMEA